MPPQAQHEIKRRERDYEKLQGRLRDLLVEKSREQKVALEAVGRFRDTARVRAKKSDEAMYQVRQLWGATRILTSLMFGLVAQCSTPHESSGPASVHVP